MNKSNGQTQNHGPSRNWPAMVFRGVLLSGTVFPTINVFKGVILRRASKNVIFMSLIKNIFHGSLHIIRSSFFNYGKHFDK